MTYLTIDPRGAILNLIEYSLGEPAGAERMVLAIDPFT
jgi:hypothetical protein